MTATEQTTALVPHDGDPALTPDAILSGAVYDFARAVEKCFALMDAALYGPPPRRRRPTRHQRHMLRVWTTPRQGKRKRRH